MPINFVPLFPGMPGGIEMAVVLLIVVLLFGANKLPKLARSSGQAMGEFKKGREEIEDELQNMRDDTVGDMDESPDGGGQNPPQSGQNAPQSDQRQGDQQRQGNQRQGQGNQQRQGNQRRGGQSSSDTSADEWGSAATNRDRETNRR